MLLDSFDLQVLSVIARHPEKSIRELSFILKCNPKTLARRVEKLINGKILLGVAAYLCYSALDLELMATFIEAPSRNYELVERVLYYFPYTRYHIRCFGKVNGLFTLVAIPYGTLPLYLELLNILREKEVITKYSVHRNIARPIYSEPDFTLYDLKQGVWKFDWDRWGEEIPSAPTNFLRENPSSILYKLSEVDIKILEQLTANARIKRKKIAEKLGLPMYQISRRISFLEQSGVIDKYRALFGSMLFGLYTSALLKVETTVDEVSRVGYAFSKMPFQGTLIPIQEGFIMYLAMPPVNFPKLMNILLDHAHSIDVMVTDYGTSRRYWLWPGAFKEGRWMASREFMVDDVLKSAGLEA